MAFCFEPNDSPPSCVDQLFDDSFKSDWEFSSCKREVESYTSELSDWVQCVNNEAEERAEEAVKKFNCKAEGESFCY